MSRDMRKELEEIDKKYINNDYMLGKNLLTFPNRLNSSRGLMFGSMLDQVVVLDKPEIPLIHTNYEYIVGKYSSAYYKTEGDLEIIKRINKFPNSPDSIYVLLVYNKTDKIYDVIIKKPGERLTETYGYRYNTDVLDNLEEKQTVKKDTVLYKSTSFDDDMMYRYGVNATALYTTDPMTIEDALVISTDLAKRLESIEYDVIRISKNDNDIFINQYGDSNHYKSFPDIGEEVKDSIIAVKRRISYAQAPFELKEENMTKILSTDEPFYVPFAKDKIVDIRIYCNKPLDEIKDSPVDSQINSYLRNEMEYYETIKNTLEPIIQNERYSDDLADLYSRVTRILDPEVKWKDNTKSKVFNNMIIEFLVEKRISVCVGQKLCGRYGDKGVISEIRPTEEMPILETGERVHMICNVLGVVNRLKDLVYVKLS